MSDTKTPAEEVAATVLTPEERFARVQALFDRLVAAAPIYNFLLSTSTLASVAEGSVVVRLELSANHVNSRGGIHGAVSAAFVDFSTGLAIASVDGRASTGASVDMHVSYLSVASAGDVVEIRAVAERVGRNLGYTTCRVVKMSPDGGEQVVALGQHSKYVSLPAGKKGAER